MKIEKILSKRYGNIYNPKTYQATQIVYEWEDILAVTLEAPVIAQFNQENTLLIEMSPQRKRGKLNSNKVIPWIVDFYINKPLRLLAFYLLYIFNRVVLISSKEAFDNLMAHHCPLKIRHLALSLPDQYRIKEDTVFDKCYDLVMIGRMSPILKDYAMKYATSHPDFTYVYQKREGTNCVNYDQNNNVIAEINDRWDYMNFMKKSRVMLYSTPSMDIDCSSRSHGFNQVTPKFLEYIACGCHVIARYPYNSDVDYYELDKMVLARVNTYEEFEKAMDFARKNNVDMKKYSEYLEKHYTSVRVEELKSILSNLK